MEKTFIKIYVPGLEDEGGRVFYCEPTTVPDIIAEMVSSHEDGNEQVYEFKTVSMTQKEFESLPEFRGF